MSLGRKLNFFIFGDLLDLYYVSHIFFKPLKARCELPLTIHHYTVSGCNSSPLDGIFLSEESESRAISGQYFHATKVCMLLLTHDHAP